MKSFSKKIKKIKTIKTLQRLTVMFVCSFLIYSCSKEDNTQQNSNLKTEIEFNQNGVKIQYSSKIIENKLNFRIKIKNNSSLDLINEEFNVSNDKSVLPIEISHQISLKQKRLSSNFSLSEINILVDIMDNMVNTVTKDMKDSELRDSKTQGLFMSNSLIKSIRRQIKKNNIALEKNSQIAPQITRENSDINVFTSNTVYEGFNRELSSFALTEDIIMNIEKLKNYISNDTLYAKEKGFFFVKEIIANIPSMKYLYMN